MAKVKPIKPGGLRDLANRIGQYLHKFEASPTINRWPENHPTGQAGTRPFYHATAQWPGGNRLMVVYVSYQGPTFLTRAEATKYLAWLDAGHVGRHYKALKETK